MTDSRRLSLSKDKINILLLEGVHQGAIDYFKKAGYGNITVYDHALSERALEAILPDVHILGIRSRTQLSDKMLEQATKLVAVGCFCIGTNQVALLDAQKKGIPVFNAPYANTRSVAELVIAEIICLYRGVVQKHMQLTQGQWQKSAVGSHEVRGKTLGIIGYGHIGSQLGLLAESLGMQVQYYDIDSKLSLGNATGLNQLSDLLKRSDVISLHVPETAETKGLIDKAAIAMMKKNAILINASRGSVVDIESLASALQNNALLGAAVDVFPEEPESAKVPFESPLRTLPNVILTPHIGGATLEAQKNISIDVAAKLVRYSDNGTSATAVNFPQVSLPVKTGVCRLLHIHWNKPGVLSRVNEIFSSHKDNIVAQYLQTNAQVGYVVLDVETEQPAELLQQLKGIPETIKTRVLY